MKLYKHNLLTKTACSLLLFLLAFGSISTIPAMAADEGDWIGIMQSTIIGDDLACDGDFAEWKTYPHTLIGYAAVGQQDSNADGKAALCVSDGILYGHVKADHVGYLGENGSEFLAAIEIAFNGDLEYKDLPEKGNFYPRMVTMDGNTTVSEGVSNPNGISTYRISDIRETAPEAGSFFGEMKIKINEKVDEMEFAINLERVASYIGCDANKFQTIYAKFGRIGNEWVQTGEASTKTAPDTSILSAVLISILGIVLVSVYIVLVLKTPNAENVSHLN